METTDAPFPVAIPMPVVLLVIGLAAGLWQLAVVTNWRGYADGHLARSNRTAAALRRLPPYRWLPPPDPAATRPFMAGMQRAVAAVLMLAGFGLAAVAVAALFGAVDLR